MKFSGLLIILVHFTNGIMDVYPKLELYALRKYDVTGEPLFVTPYIKKGLIKEAQKKALVLHSEIAKVESYSGFFTVNEKYNSNLFFWFFPAEIDRKNAPVVLWLQGGPGSSSLFGLFVENGPFTVKRDKLINRKYSWHMNHNLIFIDNPVGTGFSFTDADAGYANNDFEAGKNVLNGLIQFFQLFPDLQQNDFYLTGESYAGKYLPALGFLVDVYNKGSKDIKINLKGLAIGNGFTDPLNQMDYGNYLFQVGLIDGNGREQLNSMEDKIKNLILQKENKLASSLLDQMVVQSAFLDEQKRTLLQNLTNFDSLYNYLFDKEIYGLRGSSWQKWVQKEDVRKSLHVGNSTFHTDIQKVHDHLKEDSVNSVAPYVATLLDGYRILIYNGQLDIVIPYPLTVNYLLNMKWPGNEEYRLAERKIWKVNGELAGYSKQVGNLTEVLVRNAGHMVPTDQPLWAWKLITSFTRNEDILREKTNV